MLCAVARLFWAERKVEKADADKKATGLAATWGRLVWEKWRWGALIAFAVMVSRFSSA